MKKHHYLIKYGIIILSSLFIFVYMYLIYKYTFATVPYLLPLSLCLFLMLWGGFCIYLRFVRSEIRDSYITISDMLENIFSETYTLPYSETEDHIFSKLTAQVMRLRALYYSHINEAMKDKQEIQELISDISHQLKTPLSNIKIYGDMLKQTDISPKDRENFTTILYHQLDKLNFLTESLIKMSRLESGVIQLNIEHNSLNQTVLKAVNQVYQKAMKKETLIELVKNDTVNLNHDVNWITEAIFNLLDNAIKYTSEQGTIKISIQSYEMFARIDVEDNGIGVPQEETTLIFQRFFRGRHSIETEGIGLGLYLTRNIVALHGGYIKLTSSPKGSVFSVFLPL